MSASSHRADPRPRHRALKSYRLPVALAVGGLMTTGLVASIGPAQAATRIVPANQVDQSETRSAGHNVFDGTGVRVYTDDASSNAKAAGYFDVDEPLADIGEPSMSWSRNTATTTLRPGMQLKVDFDDDGNIDGILVGEPTYADGSPLYGDDWWLSNTADQFVKAGAPSHTGGSGSPNHGTLEQWRAAFPDAFVLQGGWSLGSGVHADGTILDFTIGGDTYYFVPAEDTTTKVLYSTDVDQSETRAKGHNTFRPTSGVDILTEDATSDSKAAGYFPTDVALGRAGEPVMDYHRISGGVPGLQLVTDFDGDGQPDGILVGEPGVYGNDWWLTNGSQEFVKVAAPSHGGGFGSTNHGQLSEWRHAFPDARIVAAGWSLGSGIAGHGVLSAITVGTTRYTFTGANRAPSAAPVTGSGDFGHDVTVTLAGTDPDGDALTYTAGTTDDGTVAIAGDQATFTPADGFSGSTTFDYTATDPSGASASSTVTITIGAAPEESPLELTATVNRFLKTVTIKGKIHLNRPGGGSLVVHEGTKVITGGIAWGSVINLPLGRQSVGTHVYVVTYGGNAWAPAATGTITVDVS